MSGSTSATNRSMPALAAGLGQVLQQQLADPAALVWSSTRNATSASPGLDACRSGRPRSSRRPRQHEGHPVDVVDLGEPVDVPLRQLRHRGEEPVVLRLVGDRGVELDQQLGVLGPDRPDVGRPPVAQQDVGLPVTRVVGVACGLRRRSRRANLPAAADARPPACPRVAARTGVRGECAPWHGVRRRSTPPDDFEEHILDTDVGDEMRVVLPGVRLLGHLLPGAARRPRRPQAGAAPDPLHDGRHGPAARPRPRQERPRRRRGHGPAAPARRRRDLRRPGADGAALVDAAADDRRPRQLRLARRLPRRDALHRVPDGAAPPWR